MTNAPRRLRAIYTTELLLDRYGGDLRNLREEASRDPERERELLKEFKGTGDVGTDVFFREVQVAWDESFPFADRRALEGARELGLEDNAEALAQLVGHRDFPKLVAALVRVQLEGDHDEVLEGDQQFKECIKGTREVARRTVPSPLPLSTPRLPPPSRVLSRVPSEHNTSASTRRRIPSSPPLAPCIG